MKKKRETNSNEFIPFNEAKVYIQSLNFKNYAQWIAWARTKRPKFIPSSPNSYYSKEWKGISDWLGNGKRQYKSKGFLPFEDARKIIRKLKFKNVREWRDWAKTKRPLNIPFRPDQYYKEDFICWKDWLGNNIYSRGKFWDFEKARSYVRSLNLNNQKEWLEWVRLNNPDFLPKSPGNTYKNEWKGFPDFLGNRKVSWNNRNYYSFDKARWYVRRQGLKSMEEWKEWSKTNRPHFIPSRPDKVYSKFWVDHSDFIGSGVKRAKAKDMLSFEDARKIVRKQKINNHTGWRKWSKIKRPRNIPSTPNRSYPDQWKGWQDWFGM